MIKIAIIIGSKFIENIRVIEISFIRNPKNGGIPARDKKFIKIKNAIKGFMFEKKNSLIFLKEEKVKEKIKDMEIIE